MMFKQTFHFVAFALLLALLPSVNAVLKDFEDRSVRQVLGPTDLYWTSDGRLLVSRKEGMLWVLEDPDGDFSYSSLTQALDLSGEMCTNSERGMGSVAADPDFAENNFIYIYWTYNIKGDCEQESPNGPVNRLSRFVLPPNNQIDRDSEVVLLQTPTLLKPRHNAGDIIFGKDGHIYITIGDAADMGTQQRLNNILGKIVRISKDGSIPQDNPYAADGVRCHEQGHVGSLASDNGQKCAEIFAYGLRNPWRMAMDPNTDDGVVRLYINDVGADNFEEVNEGGTNFPGANYGWPEREGPCERGQTQGCEIDTDFDDPVHYYFHDTVDFDIKDRAVTAAAFIPRGVWPAEFDGMYLYADYPISRLYILEEDGEECRSCNPPRSGMKTTLLTEWQKIVSMAFGPYVNGSQTLYYLSRDNRGELRRVTYVGEFMNHAPFANMTADVTSGAVGTAVSFDATGSSDADDDTLSFSWNFGDGNVAQDAGAVTSHTFETNGVFDVKLTVTDGKGGLDTTTETISIGTLPTPVIESPPEGTKFAVGDKLILSGFARDGLTGELLDDKSLTWEVRQHHSTHYHPFLDPRTGNDITLLQAPAPEDYIAATNSFLEVLLTATDWIGLSATVSRKVMPRTVELNMNSVPSGLTVYLDTAPLTLPAVALTWENQDLLVESPNQGEFAWVRWSDGGAQSRTIKVPPADSNIPTMTMYFEETKDVFIAEATASSFVDGGMAMNAIDGDPTTAWRCERTDSNATEWLLLDFGSEREIATVLLEWDATSFGSKYVIESSETGSDFVEAFVEFNGNGGKDVVQLPPGTVARYIRINAVESSATGGGISLREASVKGFLAEDVTQNPGAGASDACLPSFGTSMILGLFPLLLLLNY